MTGASRKFKNLFIYPKFLLRTGLFYIFIATNTVLIGKLAIELIDSPMTAYICCFLLLMIVGLSGAWYAHRVTGPMIGIKRTCKLIAAGRHDLRVKLRSNDEFADVATAINEMIEALQPKGR